MHNTFKILLVGALALSLFPLVGSLVEAETEACTCTLGYAGECEWKWDETEIDDDTRIDLPGNECLVGEVRDSYFLQTINARISGTSIGWAYDDSNLCGATAQAVAKVQSDSVITFTFDKRCDYCIGKVTARYDPGVEVCANLYNPPSHAFIAALMAARCSLADNQGGSVIVFQGTTEASAEGELNSGSGAAHFTLGASPITVSFSHGNGTADVGSIGGAQRILYYTVGADSDWEIIFSHTAALKVDVLANSGFLDIGEGHARSGDSTWDAKFVLSCGGGCRSSNDETQSYELQWNQDAGRIDCTRP